MQSSWQQVSPPNSSNLRRISFIQNFSSTLKIIQSRAIKIRIYRKKSITNFSNAICYQNFIQSLAYMQYTRWTSRSVRICSRFRHWSIEERKFGLRGGGKKGQGARERQASSFWRPREPRDAKVWDRQWSAGTMKNGSPLFPAVSIQFEPENRRLAVSRDAIYPSTRLLDTIDNLSLSFAAVSRPCLNFPMNDASSETSWSTFAPRKTAWN